MGRHRIFIALAIAGAVSASVATAGLAQVPQQPITGPVPGGADPGNALRPQLRPARPPQQLRPSPQARERWREMSPEDRGRFRSNAERWLQLQPEERKALRDKEDYRRQRIIRDSEEALEKSGLQLEAEKREAWQRQYQQERKKIERTLRQEIEEKRQHELAPVVERLKKEFSQTQGSASPSASAAPTSPAPKK